MNLDEIIEQAKKEQDDARRLVGQLELLKRVREAYMVIILPKEGNAEILTEHDTRTGPYKLDLGREPAPIYVMGRVDPLQFTKGKTTLNLEVIY